MFSGADFAWLYASRGRPAWSPGMLVLVLVMQFAEVLSDRQTADAGTPTAGPEVPPRAEAG
ncbi:transposase [Streptomyces californicus]|uniref:transposase n=1 Tax=Streptomyces californicus TaxID=67351 RepID=UPI0036EC2BFE